VGAVTSCADTEALTADVAAALGRGGGPSVLGEIVVLVGTSASGKTTLRRELLSRGLDHDQVVSLDDLRRRARDRDVAASRPPRGLQEYSAVAVRHGSRWAHVLAAFGAGYLADAGASRRRDRREHLAIAADTGLRARAVLLAEVPLDELTRRNARRPRDEQVPADVLRRQVHRRSLLSAEMLAAEGFSGVIEV
jgi:predicted kinase